MIATKFYVLLGAMLFAVGAAGAMVRKNVLVILMCIEIMLNGVTLTLLAYAVDNESAVGQIAAFFVMAVAAAEAAVGLAIIVAIFRTAHATSVDEMHLLKW